MDYKAWKQTWGISLNQQQEAAVQAADGPVLLLAVPGSGKTTVLIHRLGYLMDCRGIPPERILTVTYTVAATRDMRARFARTFGEDRAGRLEFRTINGLSARIIQYYERAMGRQAFQLVTDEGALSALVGELFRACTGTFATESTIKGLRTAITYGKNRQMSREEMEALSTGELPVAQVYQAYCRVLRQRGWMDYDDQMVYAAQILRRHGEILSHFQETYTHLCVDEAQDTSRIQHTILRLLAGRRQNLFLVGDEDQSIYGFRAAEPGALLRFERDYPGGRVLFLEKNYRSTQTIVTAADGFIRQNHNRRDKHMTAARGPGPALEELWVYDRAAQYAYLARLARDCPQETAVLYRNNESALPVLDLLDRQGIVCRCRQMDGTFFTHRVVRDVADFFAFAVNPADGACFLRMYYKLRAGITKGAAQWAVRTGGAEENLLDVLAQCPGLSQWSRVQCQALSAHFARLREERGDWAVDRLRHAMGYGEYLKERGGDLGKLDILEALGRHVPNLGALLDRLEELRTLVRQERQGPGCGLILSTIHASKGLEYQRVILMDVADGLLPLGEAPVGKNPDPAVVEAYEEERRLFYVGMTRAKETLAVFRFQKPGLASAFSAALFPPKAKPQPVRARPKPAGGRPAEGVPDGTGSLPGVSVTHRTFGSGKVVSRQGDIATILFEGGEEKRIALSVALRRRQLWRSWEKTG